MVLMLQVSTKEFVPEVQSKHVPKENCTPIDSNRVEAAVSPTKTKVSKQQQQPVKELETVYINQELILENQPDSQKNNKIVKVKAESPKSTEHPVKETTPTEEASNGKF